MGFWNFVWTLNKKALEFLKTSNYAVIRNLITFGRILLNLSTLSYLWMARFNSLCTLICLMFGLWEIKDWQKSQVLHSTVLCSVYALWNISKTTFVCTSETLKYHILRQLCLKMAQWKLFTNTCKTQAWIGPPWPNPISMGLDDL